MPGSLLSLYSPVKGRSVPFSWVTWYCAGVSFRTAASVFAYFIALAPLLIFHQYGEGPQALPLWACWGPIAYCPSRASWPSGRIRALLGRLVGAAQVLGAVQKRDVRERLGEIRSEEHTSELQSLMRISYAVFCLKKKKKQDLKEQHNTLRVKY